MKIALALVSITFRLSIALIVQVQNHETVSRSAQALPDPSPTKESQSTAITRRTHVSFSCDRRVITRIHMGAEIDNALYLLRDFCSAASQATQRASLTTTTTTSASADNNFYLDTLEHHFGRGLNWDIVNIIHKRYEKIVHELNAAPRGKVLVRCDDPQQRCAERFFNTPVDIYFHTEMRYINVCESFLPIPLENDEGALEAQSQVQLLFRALSQIQAVFDRDGDVDGDDASLEQPLSDPDEVRWVPGILDNERYYEFAKDVYMHDREEGRIPT